MLNKKVGTFRFRRTSLPLIRRIIKMLEAGYYPAYIADTLGKSRGHIQYYLNHLENACYIEVKPHLYVTKSRGVIKLYQVTQAGSNFLADIERGAVGRRLRLHNVYWKFPLVDDPRIPIDWRRVEMTNWTQFVGTELGFRVRKNPHSVEILSGVADGSNPFELLLKSFMEANRVARHLEDKFRMRLGIPSLSRKPHFGIYDPVADVYSKFFQLDTSLAKIDRSEGLGEIDWLSPYASEDYLKMPKRISRIEENQRSLLEGQRLFNEGMLRHMELIEEIRQLVEILEDVLLGGNITQATLKNSPK
jgi:hypothetical protein